MLLPFSQQLNGKPTFFVEKIWSAALRFGEYKDLFADYLHPDGRPSWSKNTTEYLKYKPKFHTIRADIKNRWASGKKIHPVINNRTKNMMQFVPTLDCKSVQKIAIRWDGDFCFVEIDGVPLVHSEVCVLAVNDGFDSAKEFFEYFKEDFQGKIIHWTDLKY